MKTNQGPCTRLTFDNAVDVWQLRWQGWLQSRIAAHFDANQGRVSEILKEKTHIGSREEAAKRFGTAA